MFPPTIFQPPCFNPQGGFSVHLPCPPGHPGCLMVDSLRVNLDTNAEFGACPPPSDPPTFGPNAPNIYPGLSSPLPNDTVNLTACTWTDASLNPFTILENFEGIYNQGVADATFWLKANGWL